MPLYNGKDLCALMRQHRMTIAALAQTMGISQARVRTVRAHGLSDPHYLRDWVQAITGADPGPV